MLRINAETPPLLNFSVFILITYQTLLLKHWHYAGNNTVNLCCCFVFFKDIKTNEVRERDNCFENAELAFHT